MKTALKFSSFLALAGIIAMAIGFFADVVSLERVKAGMLICTAVWFGTAP